jgi:hypothetical protein
MLLSCLPCDMQGFPWSSRKMYLRLAGLVLVSKYTASSRAGIDWLLEHHLFRSTRVTHFPHY